MNLVRCIILSALFPFSGIAELNWNQTIQQVRDRIQSKTNPYPEAADILDGMFLRYPITHIVIHGYSESRKPNTTDLYISEKEIFVSQSEEGWNLYADTDHIFEWEQGGASTFVESDVADLSGLIVKLTTRSDPVSQYIREKFPAERMQILTDQNSTKQQQQSALVAGLNQILLDGSLYRDERFASVKLSPGTIALKSQFSQDESSMLRNRLLLEDAYPLELKRDPQARQQGVRIKRDNQSLVDYLCYLVDPAGIMFSLYCDYKSNPSAYTRAVRDHSKQIVYCLNKPVDGFTALTASEKPLWFYGFQTKDEKTGRIVEFEVSGPEGVRKIPARIRDQFKMIHFEDSALSLNRHLSFF